MLGGSGRKLGPNGNYTAGVSEQVAVSLGGQNGETSTSYSYT